MTNLVYPGALHTRFHHAIGAMHLMTEAIDVLRSKQIEITDEEAEAVSVAILLHDIGHGPFSHALEHTLVQDVNHEDISALLMEKLNKEYKGRLTLAINIFNNKYKKKFLHQLVSSQLDMDRLDYLRRDSFFTGVSEGVISSDRIIKMLNVKNDELVIEEKGIYSIEKFIIARRLMYWQVYLHKTVLAGMELMVNILKRAKELADDNVELFCTPAFREFLYNHYNKKDFVKNPDLVDTFAKLDDYDVLSSIKGWMNHKDFVLSVLCKWLITRNLYAIKVQKEPWTEKQVKSLQKIAKDKYNISAEEMKYFVFSDEVVNDIYNSHSVRINILSPDGTITDFTKASDNLNASVLDKVTRKYFVCYPKGMI